jgi:Protein of unknown function (DUF3443)
LRTKNAFLRVLGAFGFAAIVALVAGCGGGGSGGGGSTNSGTPSAVANQVTVTVGQGLKSVANIPTVSVTVCAPGTPTCQTIDNIQVDSMSYGLRLVSTAASQVLGSLPVEKDGSGNEVSECTVFADGFTWGKVHTADVKIGGETAGNIPIGILGDQTVTVPPSCTSQTAGGAENTVDALGVNGVLGIGVAPFDCGSFCADTANNNFYYSCTSGSCTSTTLALASQLTNPVAKFATNNNGAILTMPAVGSSGSASVSGTLTFGIGTQSNNALPATVAQFATDSFGHLNSTTFGGTASAPGTAFFDSGSNAYFFNDASLTGCTNTASFYCPASPTSRNVTVSSMSTTNVRATTIAMSITDANSLFRTGNFAFNNLAGPFGSSSVIDFGLPFFYNRTVYFGYDRRPLGGTQTPFVAF